MYVRNKCKCIHAGIHNKISIPLWAKDGENLILSSSELETPALPIGIHMYMQVHPTTPVAYTVLVTETYQNPTNSAEILCRFCKASMQLTAEFLYEFRRASLLSTECLSTVRGVFALPAECLWCVRILRRTQGTYVHTQLPYA